VASLFAYGFHSELLARSDGLVSHSFVLASIVALRDFGLFAHNVWFLLTILGSLRAYGFSLVTNGSLPVNGFSLSTDGFAPTPWFPTLSV
jgi:hypothetical protein